MSDNVVVSIASDGDASKGTPLSVYPEVGPNEVALSDGDFMAALKRLKSLCTFLLQVPASSSQQVLQAARLGGQNQLHSGLRTGSRRASYQEWEAVETRTQIIWSALSETQRRKFLATQIPSWISYLISTFIVLAAASLVTAYLVQIKAVPAPLGGILIPFLLWIIALGAIGAAASGLGAAGPSVSGGDVAKQASLLLLPFILGFSTSLVILILNRFIESVQTFFGKVASDRRVQQS